MESNLVLSVVLPPLHHSVVLLCIEVWNLVGEILDKLSSDKGSGRVSGNEAMISLSLPYKNLPAVIELELAVMP